MDLGTDRVLVTGSAGWLGRGLIAALTRGLPDCPSLGDPRPDLAVRALVHPGEGPSRVRAISDRVEVVAGDLRRREDCAQFCDGARDAII